MSKDVIVILHRSAIPAAHQIYPGLLGCKVFLFDPVLVDPVTAAGFDDVELFTGLGGPSYHTMDRDAHASAFALEAHLDSAQRDGGSTVSIAGWQHLSLYYLFIMTQWYSGLWERMAPRLREHHVHVLLNDNPADYYLDSFVPSSLLVHHLQTHSVPFTCYDYGARAPSTYPVPDLSGTAPDVGDDCLLTHLPTCFYDIGYFSDEIQATNKFVVNLKALRWDVPTPAHQQIGLTDAASVLGTLPAAMQERVAAATSLLSAALQRRLTPNLPLPEYRKRQADHIARTYGAQLVTFFEFRRFFHDTEAATILISEHDAGFHGPVISFAESRSLPVIMLPHSKVGSDIEFKYAGITMLTHPMQGLTIHDAAGRSVTQNPISLPERFCSTSAVGAGLRIVSVLLNAPSLNGVPYVPTDAYLQGVKRILDWCALNDVIAKIRCKPSYSIIGILHAQLGIDPGTLRRNAAESMDDHARECDLCLMYDMATTGAYHFLSNSIPILNPAVSAPAAPFMAIAHPDVITTESLDATLHRLDLFKSNPSTLYTFRAAQFLAYLNRFQPARPLRTYLQTAGSAAAIK